jgi:transposase InsO family protein
MVINDINIQRKRTGFRLNLILKLYGINKSRYYAWFDDNGELKSNIERQPIKTRILPEEIERVINYRKEHRDVGYRKLTWMMNDANVAYMSESSVYNLLSARKMLYGWDSVKGTDTEKEYKHKPQFVHHHWHTDIAYIKIMDNYYFLIMLLDGYSRFLLGWELMTDMLLSSVQMFVQRVKEKYPDARPMLINDNGSQFISNDFKGLITRLQIQQVFTRRNHPQTNGKIERMNKTVKDEAIRVKRPGSYQEAIDILQEYEYIYNYQRLHAGIKFLRPADVFFNRQEEVLRVRREKIQRARMNRIIQNSRRKYVSYSPLAKVQF